MNDEIKPKKSIEKRLKSIEEMSRILLCLVTVLFFITVFLTLSILEIIQRFN